MNAKRFSYFLLGMLGLTIAAIVLTFWLGQRKLNSRIAKIQRLSGDIQLETEQIQRLQDLESSYQQIAPLANKVQTILPSQKQQAEIVALVAAIVQGNSLPLNGINFEATQGLPSDRSQTLPAKIPGILEMPMSFESSGSYPQLQALLKSFEKQQRYIQISSLEITGGGGDKLDFNIKLQVFVKP